MFIIKLIIAASFLRPITILIHELGHGIPALLVSKGKVSLFIGSYGDTDKSFRLKIKRLELFFKKENPLYWKVGLCNTHDKEISLYQQFAIVLCGPLASLLLAAFLGYVIFFTVTSDDLIFILFVFMVSSVFDFYLNIVPKRKPIVLQDGSITHNDGQQLIELLKYRKFYADYKVAAQYYEDKNYKQAASLLEKIMESGVDDEYLYKLTISSFLLINDNKKALSFNESFTAKHKANFTSDDFYNSGLIKFRFENYEEAIIDYGKALEIDPKHKYSLNNRGYTYNLIFKYKEAIVDLDKAIEIAPDFAFAINNRGLAKIKLGKMEEGLADIEKSMSLDDTNSYAYMNLGIYHYDKQNYKEALIHFEKALELDEDTFFIHKHIEETKIELGLV